jgi:transposase-like protein
MRSRDDATIELSQEQRTELEKVARSRRIPQAMAQRARIVLMTADGVLPGAIGEQLGVSQPTIRKWRARYAEHGLPGLRSEARPGRPRTLDEQRVADLLNQALQTRPAKQTHWSVRSFAARRTSARTWLTGCSARRALLLIAHAASSCRTIRPSWRRCAVCVRPSHLDPGHETVVSGQAAGDQRCGSSSSIRLAGCVGSRSSTSLKYA